jgi:hypothetical protein
VPGFSEVSDAETDWLLVPDPALAAAVFVP